MRSVICGVDESGSEDAVRAAIESCRAHGTALRLVGVVVPRLGDSTRATGGERVRRNKTVRAHLDRAVLAARSARVPATTTVRAGELRHEAMREGEAIGATDVFFVRTRGRLRAALTGKPRTEVAHVSLGRPAFGELTVAA